MSVLIPVWWAFKNMTWFVPVALVRSSFERLRTLTRMDFSQQWTLSNVCTISKKTNQARTRKGLEYKLCWLWGGPRQGQTRQMPEWKKMYQLSANDTVCNWLGWLNRISQMAILVIVCEMVNTTARSMQAGSIIKVLENHITSLTVCHHENLSYL